MINTISLPITKRETGYDIEQVEKYFEKITSEYSKLRQSYIDLSDKYEMMNKTSSSADVVSKEIADAKMQAMRIIAGAKTEANRITNDAYQTLQAIQAEKALVIAEISEIVHRLRKLGVVEEPYNPYETAYISNYST